MLLKTFKFVIDKHIKVIFKLSFVQVNFIDLSWDAFKSNWLQDSSVQRIFLNSFNKTYFKFNILPLHYTVHCTVNSLKFLVFKDNIYIDMQAGRNLLPKLPVADN